MTWLTIAGNSAERLDDEVLFHLAQGAANVSLCHAKFVSDGLRRHISGRDGFDDVLATTSHDDENPCAAINEKNSARASGFSRSAPRMTEVTMRVSLSRTPRQAMQE